MLPTFVVLVEEGTDFVTMAATSSDGSSFFSSAQSLLLLDDKDAEDEKSGERLTV